MNDRDGLIAILHAAQCLDAQQGDCDDAVCPQAVAVQADAILARWRLVPVHEHTWEFYDSDDTYKEIDACDCGLWRDHLHRCRVNEYGQHQCELASWHAHTDDHGPHEE